MNAKQNSILGEILTIKQGDVYEEEFSVSAEQFLEFSKLTGDTNPIHPLQVTFVEIRATQTSDIKRLTF